MIIVSGEARSGTSLMMLIIRELGFTVAGKKYTSDRTFINNPTGNWELPGIPYNGIKEELKEDVVKLITRGLLRTPKRLWDKLIYCIRDPREIIYSQRVQQNYTSDKQHIENYLMYQCQLHDRVLDWSNILVVDYAKLMKDPKAQIKRVAEYLGVEPTQAAFDTPNPALYRSLKVKIDSMKYRRAAMKYYNALKKLS